MSGTGSGVLDMVRVICRTGVCLLISATRGLERYRDI